MPLSHYLSMCLSLITQSYQQKHTLSLDYLSMYLITYPCPSLLLWLLIHAISIHLYCCYISMPLSFLLNKLQVRNCVYVITYNQLSTIEQRSPITHPCLSLITYPCLSDYLSMQYTHSDYLSMFDYLSMHNYLSMHSLLIHTLWLLIHVWFIYASLITYPCHILIHASDYLSMS